MSKGNFREIVATSLMQQHLFINRDDARLAISIMIDELVRLAVHEGYVEVRGVCVDYWLPTFNRPGTVSIAWPMPFRLTGESTRSAREIANAMITACEIGDKIRAVGVDADKEARR